jgi:hypothetical protein
MKERPAVMQAWAELLVGKHPSAANVVPFVAEAR